MFIFFHIFQHWIYNIVVSDFLDFIFEIMVQDVMCQEILRFYLGIIAKDIVFELQIL